ARGWHPQNDGAVALGFQLRQQFFLTALGVVEPADAVIMRIDVALGWQTVLVDLGDHERALVPPVDESFDRMRKAFLFPERAHRHRASLRVADTLESNRLAGMLGFQGYGHVHSRNAHYRPASDDLARGL